MDSVPIHSAPPAPPGSIMMTKARIPDKEVIVFVLQKVAYDLLQHNYFEHTGILVELIC